MKVEGEIQQTYYEGKDTTMKPQIPHLSFSIIIFVLFTGCFERDLKPAPEAPKAESAASNASEVAIKALTKPDDFTDVEITLEAPDTPVDGFVIQWGTSPDAMLQTQRIAIGDLTKAPSSGGKELYSYRLRDIKNSEKLFVSIASFVGDDFSEPSEPMEVK